ncbi:HpcH/HpaI aldolase/citrate lyase family protein [Rhodococcus sp. ACT016]|uniref:HpcH/HpaI aldolase/citrate lyase family protein n=1 Tax=Rhodococcus sp. ACT016 TaxID=3134808 RepID=UPI003D2E37F2
MHDLTASARTLLFTPADRPTRFAGTLSCGADLSVLDLEDAVSAERKREALGNAASWLSHHPGAVRVNGVDTEWFVDEVAALRDIDCAVMLPKSTEGTLRELAAALAGSTANHPIIALVETAEGVLETDRIAALPHVTRMALGSFDLAAELGVDPARSPLIDRARAQMAFSSAAAGLPAPIDSVTASISDARVLAGDVAHARQFGFTGKLCIHPAQVEPVHAALTPGPEEIHWAREILAAAAAPGAAGVLAVDGHMVDRPVLIRAERIVSLAGGSR